MSDHRYSSSARHACRAVAALSSCITMLFSASLVLVNPTSGSDRYYALLDQLDAHEAAFTSSIEHNQDYGAYCIERAEILASMVETAPTAEIRRNVVIELADTLDRAILNGAPTEGSKRLLAFSRKFASIEYDEGVAYLRYVRINRDFTSGVEEGGNFADKYKQYLTELREFAQTYPKCPRAASALFSLAGEDDIRGSFESAREKYQSIVANYPDTPEHEKAKGAINRLTSVGKDLVIVGADARGKKVDLADYRGKTVLLVFALPDWRKYWPAQFEQLSQLYHHYLRADFEILLVVVQCGSRPNVVLDGPDFDFPWPTIVDADNKNSSLDARYGIVATPTFIMVDQKGRMLRELRHMEDVERDVRKQFELGQRSSSDSRVPQGIMDPGQNDGKSD